ncbi:MAG TPA: Asp-tRNA(Asn)/Glu-tRNA(Gln) amidotransferase subunit GatC [Longimicrobiales bacterium]|nr:Asp-tRNA(Asn)/Glu-tRNA(Gln) amidotransferase subunit GatC [Longimicrobiales bacterium]
MPTREEVRAVARLARLSFSDTELDRMAGDLRDILAQARALRTIAASPAAGADAALAADESAAVGENAAALRDDVPGSDPLAVPPSYIAPDWRDGFFAVPRLPTHGGGAT